jgi:ribosomal protein L16/L10AE
VGRHDAIVYRVEGGQIVYLAYYNDQDQASEALRRGA